MPRVSQAETWEQMASKLWGVSYPAELQRRQRPLSMLSEAFVVSQSDCYPIAKRIQKIVFSFVVLVADPKAFDLVDQVIARFTAARFVTHRLNYPHRERRKPWCIRYRPYIIGLDGHIIKAIDLHCQKDEAAKARAKQLIDGHDVELWHGSRQIGVFKSKPKSPVTPSGDHHGMTIVANVGTRCGEVNVTWITSQEWNSCH